MTMLPKVFYAFLAPKTFRDRLNRWRAKGSLLFCSYCRWHLLFLRPGCTLPRGKRMASVTTFRTGTVCVGETKLVVDQKGISPMLSCQHLTYVVVSAAAAAYGMRDSCTSCVHRSCQMGVRKCFFNASSRLCLCRHHRSTARSCRGSAESFISTLLRTWPPRAKPSRTAASYCTL